MAQERIEGDRGRFGDLEKMIITNRVDPKLKADYLSRQSGGGPRSRATSETSAAKSRVRPHREPVRKPRTVRYTVLTVVYLAVCVGLVWTGWEAGTSYAATHGQGTKGIIYQTSCHGGSFWHPTRVCSGDFIPTDPATLRQGAVIEKVTVHGGHPTAQQLTVSRLSASGDAYALDSDLWLWTGIAAVALLIAFLALTFWPGGVVTVSRRGVHLWSERHKLKRENRKAREAADRARRERREARAAARAAAESDDTAEAGDEDDAVEDDATDDARDDAAEPADDANPVEDDATEEDTAQAGADSPDGDEGDDADR